MTSSYFKTAWRSLQRSRFYSVINIGGLAIGMAVTLIIGLWVWDELSFDKNHKHYNQLAQVWQFVQFGPEKSSYNSVPVPMAAELREKYPEFEAVSMATYNRDMVLSSGDTKLLSKGMFAETDFPGMITPVMLSGSVKALGDPSAILLSQSLSTAIFGAEDPMNKTIRLNNTSDVKVAGVYLDFPGNSSFNEVSFLASWQLFTGMDSYAKTASTQWDENSFQLFAQLREGVDAEQVSAKIKDIRMKRENPPKYKPEFFLHPMSKWHLYGDFKDGKNTGGLIGLVRLFGFTGVFVLLLACINFMNLSTARSEKRAKEVGIRKTLGSARTQLVRQFFAESLLVCFLALLFCLLLAQLFLPFFNQLAGKTMVIPWTNPVFWTLTVFCCMLAGLTAGSYPALYLSSFNPVAVLKGTYKAGRLASLPRKGLVVFQFTISVVLIIGTLVVFRQINHARHRTVGYDNSGLIEVNLRTSEIQNHFDAVRQDVLATGEITNVSHSQASILDDYGGTTNFSWKGKAPDTRPLFLRNDVSYEYGKTVGWKLLRGRDFSRARSTDSTAIVLNQAAVNLMGLKEPVNEMVKFNGKDYQVIGVVDNMIKGSPFEAVKPSFFLLGQGGVGVANIRLSDLSRTGATLKKLETIFKHYDPASPIEYKFVDEQYAMKFAQEERIGRLAMVFAILAILISCLGLFGLAAFVAEQKTKEIGIRKVLGATVLNVWQLLSREFLLLVLMSLLIASPVAWYFMQGWLQNYEYRINLSFWMVGLAGFGVLVITLLTVSFQAIRAAIANPVKSLRTE